MIKRIQAAYHGIPYEFDKLWVAGKLYLKKHPEGAEDCELLFVNRDNGWNNAVVPLLRKNGITYFYKVTGAYCAPGDDHIISPWSFDFRYHHSEPHNATKGTGE